MIASMSKEELTKQAAIAKLATIQRKKVALSVASVAIASLAVALNLKRRS